MRDGNSGVYYWENDPSRIRDKQYEIIMMNTALSLNGKHWSPFLYEIFHDECFRNYISLEEYNAPLIINKTGVKIRHSNTSWNISDRDDNLINTLNIKQENGIDVEDRVEVLKTYLNTLLK